MSQNSLPSYSPFRVLVRRADQKAKKRVVRSYAWTSVHARTLAVGVWSFKSTQQHENTNLTAGGARRFRAMESALSPAVALSPAQLCSLPALLSLVYPATGARPILAMRAGTTRHRFCRKPARIPEPVSVFSSTKWTTVFLDVFTSTALVL